MENKPLSQDELKKMTTSAFRALHLDEDNKFYGLLIQEIFFKYVNCGSAYMAFNTKDNRFELGVDPHWFKKLTLKQRVSILQHELMHFTHKTIFRLPFEKASTSPEHQQIANVAADLAINQYIKNLPDGCDQCRGHLVNNKELYEQFHPTDELKDACPGQALNIKNWLMDDGSPFPTFKTHEEYFELIKREQKKQSDKDGNPKPKEGSKEGKGKGKGKPGETTKGNVAENLRGGAAPIDQHQWDDLDEETKKKLLEEAKNLIKRTMDKTTNSYTKIPDSIKDLLQEIETLSADLNYKSILKSVIKKTVSHTDRENTWKKPNKRYGVVAPGNKLGALPQCAFYVDTSGSISTTELNEFLKVMSGFLQNGVRTCHLGLWHTDLYYKKKYKLNETIDAGIVESGGTDVGAALEDIKKTNPNLAIILTDGCYGDPGIRVTGEVIFIISKGGDKNHPLRHMGKTIPLESLK